MILACSTGKSTRTLAVKVPFATSGTTSSVESARIRERSPGRASTSTAGGTTDVCAILLRILSGPPIPPPLPLPPVRDRHPLGKVPDLQRHDEPDLDVALGGDEPPEARGHRERQQLEPQVVPEQPLAE